MNSFGLSRPLYGMVRSATIVSALLLSGCVTPVPQVLPSELRPPSFSGTLATETAAWPQADWWAGFGDPQLTALIAKAQAENRNLAAATARILEARAQAHIARSALFPQVNGQANAGNAGCNGPAACSSFGQGQSYGLSFKASYELDFWGVVQGNVRVADEQLKSARFAKQTVALSLTANVAQLYFTVLSLRQQIAIAKDYVAAIDNILATIKLRVKAAAASGLDQAREEAQIEAIRAQLPTLQIQEREALYSLAVLLGQVPEVFDIQSRDLEAIHAPLIGPGLPSDLLLRRPDVAEAEANLASAHASLDVARAAFFPQISLSTSGGVASTAIKTLLEGSHFGYQYGANLLQTIFDGGKLEGQKRLAEATEKQYVAQYQSAVLSAYADVESALVEVANNRASEDHLRQEIDAARRAFDISELQYRQGVVDLLAVLQAQQTLFLAKNQLALIGMASQTAVVHLYVALGGGWSEDPSDRTQIAEELPVSKDQ